MFRNCSSCNNGNNMTIQLENMHTTLSMRTCDFVHLTGSSNMIQVTVSHNGGVVSEPKYVQCVRFSGINSNKLSGVLIFWMEFLYLILDIMSHILDNVLLFLSNWSSSTDSRNTATTARPSLEIAACLAVGYRSLFQCTKWSCFYRN